jgi:hypothetical protein
MLELNSEGTKWYTTVPCSKSATEISCAMEAQKMFQMSCLRVFVMQQSRK